MSDDKKYYYLKLKDDFFNSDEIIVLESMQDGYLYCNILLKLYLKSLKNEGKLMFNDRIPYNSTVLSQVVRQPVGVIEKALAIFQEFNLIEVLDNGAIYILDIQNYIGQSSSEADRQRDYQRRINSEKGLIKAPKCKKSNKKSNIETNKETNGVPTPEIEIEIERYIYVKPIDKNTHTEDFETWYGSYPNKFNKEQTFRNWKSTLKNDTKENIILATVEYKKQIKIKHTDSDYIIKSSNFIGQKQQYKGYLKESTPQTTKPKFGIVEVEI